MFKHLSAVGLSIMIIAGTFTIPGKAFSETENRAKIISMHNDVQSKTSARSLWQIAHVNLRLDNGDSIRTGPVSRVEVQYKDGTITRMGANSLLRVKLPEGNNQRTDLRLLAGKLWLKVKKGAGLLKIETPTAVASVLGTELLVSNNEKDVSHVTTLDGLVEVTSKTSGETTLVHPGEWVEIVPGQPMEKPTKFDWDELKRAERFMLDPTFMPTAEELDEENNWK